MQSAHKYSRKNQFTHFAWRSWSEGLEQERDLPLNAIRNFVLSFSTALFSPFFPFSKWQVEGKGSKTLAIVYFSTANDFANFPLWQSISTRIFEPHSLCRPWTTYLSVFDCSRQDSTSNFYESGYHCECYIALYYF